MSTLSRLNPANGLVGRLFLWFWITFIFTAIVAVWLGRTFSEDMEVGTPSTEDISKLDRAVERVTRAQNADVPFDMVLERLSRITRFRLLAVNLETMELIRGGPPVMPRERDDLIRVAKQGSPILLSRGGVQFTGPRRVMFRGAEYALFLGTIQGPPGRDGKLPWVIGVAVVITMLLSYLFAKSLVKPIVQLQESTRSLAQGDWETRATTAATRHDEIGQLARDFNSMAEQLERMWNGQKRLLADISHELRSPLARLQMALGLAHQQNVDPTTLQRIEREAERMESLIAQLLQLTKAEAGKPEMTPYRIDRLLEDVMADAHFEATNRNKHFEVNSLPVVDVVVNELLICSAIENVIRNAIHYSAQLVQVSVTADDQSWKVIIKDDGPGLNEQECARIFAPFYRASLARERESGGVGLGLAIAKAAVDLHHGSITAVPGKDDGLEVTFTLPLDGRHKWNGQSPLSNT